MFFLYYLLYLCFFIVTLFFAIKSNTTDFVQFILLFFIVAKNFHTDYKFSKLKEKLKNIENKKDGK